MQAATKPTMLFKSTTVLLLLPFTPAQIQTHCSKAVLDSSDDSRTTTRQTAIPQLGALSATAESVKKIERIATVAMDY